MTLIQIDNYGPWTVTPRPRTESDLQILQAELFADVQRLIAAKKGLVFFTRFDNLLAVTNGLNEEDHMRIQRSIRNRYPITISMGDSSDCFIIFSSVTPSLPGSITSSTMSSGFSDCSASQKLSPSSNPLASKPVEESAYTSISRMLESSSTHQIIGSPPCFFTILSASAVKFKAFTYILHLTGTVIPSRKAGSVPVFCKKKAGSTP